MSTKDLIIVPVVTNSSNPADSNRIASEPIQHTVSMEVDVDISEEGSNSASFIVQPDWHKVLREDNAKAWITFKQRGQAGIHSHLLSEGESNEGESFNISCEENDFQLTKITNKSLKLSHSKAGNLQFKIIRAEKVFKNIHNKNISSLDVAPGGLGVSAGDDGSTLLVWETSQGVVRRNMQGHHGDIYNCKLFPSGVVILSSGADMRVKIWSAEDGSCPATLTGHAGPVTDTAIVDNGMNIVSTSKDGTVRIWSCGKGKCLEPAISIGDVVNCCDIINVGEDPSSMLGAAAGDNIDRNDEVGLENKILAVGGENGTIGLVNLHTRSVSVRERLPGKNAAVNAVSFLSKNLLIVGCQNGATLCYSVPALTRIWILRDSDSSIMSLLSLPKLNGFIAGKLDGSCIFYSLDSKNQLTDLRVLLSGADTEPINTIKCDGHHVFTGARDGKIRKYNLLDI